MRLSTKKMFRFSSKIEVNSPKTIQLLKEGGRESKRYEKGVRIPRYHHHHNFVLICTLSVNV